MTQPITKVAVIGAGTMGGGIAAHAANAGCQVVLLDIAPNELTPEEQAKGLTLESKAVRNRIVTMLFDRVKKARPAALFTPERAEQITLGNLTDDLGLIADADWIVEVIVEQLEPKRALMERIEQVRKPGSIVSSNTSGIPIAAIAEGRSEEFRRHFLGTHFFNPPRYLYLLEVIPTPDTAPEVVQAISSFADRRLGKGVVLAKDRPNFIANRIGTYSGQVRVSYALEHGYSVEEVDSLTGELIGNPKTATFRLFDLVGIDVPVHVTRNLYAAVPDDEEREAFTLPPLLEDMVARGWLGNKSGVGFYKQEKGAGGKEFWPLNVQTMQHEPPKKPRFELVGKARKIEDLRARLRFIMDNADIDRAGQFLRETTLKTLAYTARRIPEISDSIADVDNAMRWGFGQQLGPFQMWDALGLRKAAGMMKERGIAQAPWVEQMLANGFESFYQSEGGRVVGVYDAAAGAYAPLARPTGVIVLDDLRAQGKELARNESASVLDLGDGVLCFEFHSKVNSLDPLIMEIGFKALELLKDDRWAGMVIGNQSSDFCAGANLGIVMMGVASGQAEQVSQFTRGMQDLFMRFRTSAKPVVAAPYGRVLGGGAEISLASSRRVVAAETYIGLVEAGVGIVPGWGGCKEFVRRQVSPHMAAPGTDALPYFQKAFETIAMAKVAESAEQGRQLGFFDKDDVVVMNKERLIGEAKQVVLEMTAAGYAPPPAGGEPVYALGRRGIGAVSAALHGMRVGGYVSAHDVKVAKALAFVMSGGDLTSPQWVTEQYLLDLEFEENAKLVLEPKTQERMMAILQTGKPLRN
ncbi:MAG TPA: 3-hydroxyacyl-CoA dehydrogenase NAD-binding domain-containing protein [Kouleothrix sp.]|uniref:3-hydroxyacyl-CoA dehydrogenase/enoyl-CoA hydratase family protein n=1 Tax=Kouleothrix sp. TaxID=2779161 RepID=UPI002BADF513|nr:3-hydroxyacyl-CoA dehydrogenase NAD-binding domain-containing protein [Kouleothrix sp.]